MKTALISLISFIALLQLSGCYYDVESELYPSSNNVSCDTSNVTFTNVIQPMISANCAISGCHSSGAQLPDLSNYAGISASADRIRVRSITEKTMPPSGPLSSCSISQLQNWLNAEALNN